MRCVLIQMQHIIIHIYRVIREQYKSNRYYKDFHIPERLDSEFLQIHEEKKGVNMLYEKDNSANSKYNKA